MPSRCPRSPEPRRSRCSRSRPPPSTNAWPQKLAVSPDGRRLLVPLNLAGSADVIDLKHHDQVRNVVTGSYPFGAAILPDGRTGLVSNEAAGTLSVVDLVKGVKLRDIQVGPPLSHPQGIVVDRAGRRAYVALSALDEVVVVDLRRRRVERTISVGRSAGLGTMPVALALSPDGARLFVAESGADEIAVIRLPSPKTRPAARVDAARAHPDRRGPPGRGRPPRPGAAARLSSCTSPPAASASAPTRPALSRRTPSTPSSGPSTGSLPPPTSSASPAGPRTSPP